MITIEDIIKLLELKPHPEGGFYKETYRSDEDLSKEILPTRYYGPRCFGTCIYYLLTKETFSMIHRIKSDEIFHFYLGDPVEMLNLFPDGKGKVITIGSDLINGMIPQVIVEKGVWQGACLKEGGKFALLGTTVAPGFDFNDFEVGKQKNILSEYPEFKEIIKKLTK
jgi:uncharacterized protein